MSKKKTVAAREPEAPDLINSIRAVVSDVAEDTPSEDVLASQRLRIIKRTNDRLLDQLRGDDPDPARYGVTPTPTLCGHGDACDLPAGHPGWHHFPGPFGVSPKAGA